MSAVATKPRTKRATQPAAPAAIETPHAKAPPAPWLTRAISARDAADSLLVSAYECEPYTVEKAYALRLVDLASNLGQFGLGEDIAEGDWDDVACNTMAFMKGAAALSGDDLSSECRGLMQSALDILRAYFNADTEALNEPAAPPTLGDPAPQPRPSVNDASTALYNARDIGVIVRYVGNARALVDEIGFWLKHDPVFAAMSDRFNLRGTDWEESEVEAPASLIYIQERMIETGIQFVDGVKA